MLFIFDLDGTLIESFLYDWHDKENKPKEHPYDRVVVLPNRKERLQTLAKHHNQFAIITNQGGVAFGYNTVEEVTTKLSVVVREFDFFYNCPFSVHVCYEHPKGTIPEYTKDSKDRKPKPGMLFKAMVRHGHTTSNTIYIGDLETDKQAAEAANMTYVDAEEFFRA